MDSQQEYCCPAWRYYNDPSAIVDSLDIIPRVIIYSSKLKIYERYQQLLNVKNNGVYPRNLQYHTDSPEDTVMKVCNQKRISYLGPDEEIQIRITVHPQSKLNINRRRHVYIEATHPNLKIEIPIIVITKDIQISMPANIIFPSSALKSVSYYEYTIYNPTKRPIPAVIKSTIAQVSVTTLSNKIPQKDYLKVLLKLSVNNKVMNQSLRVKLGNDIPVSVQMFFKSIPIAFHIGESPLQFEEVKFQRSSTKELTICNEASDVQSYSIRFLTTTTELDNISAKNLTSEDSESTDGSGSYYHLSTTKSPKPKIVPLDVMAYKHFSLDTMKGNVKANSMHKFIVTFHPVMDNANNLDDSGNPPFQIITKIFITLTYNQHTVEKSLTMIGFVNGPEMEFAPSFIDMRSIYLGEEHCELIQVSNKDSVIMGKVYFKDFIGDDIAHVTITPANGFELESHKSATFHLSFFTHSIGKFIVKLRFKVQNGAYYNVIVKGVSFQVRVKTYPDLLEYGSIPVAVPQKRKVLLMNPLSVPLTFQCYVPEDGRDTPLVLHIHNVDAALPITVYDPIKKMEDRYDVVNLDNFPPVRCTSREVSIASFHSNCDDNTSYSSVFENEILDPISDYATLLINNIKKKRILEKNELETKVIGESLRILLNTKYFNNIDEHRNYAYMDWNDLPSDPKEIYVDSEIVYLRPRTGKFITVILIPNALGYHNRHIEIRVCPVEECKGEGSKFLVKSNIMIAKLWLEYQCLVPTIEWQNEVNFQNQTIYAGQEYPFQMEFDNVSNVGGFAYYDVVPHSKDGIMSFRNNVWKFFVHPDDISAAECSVKFFKLGDTKLPGLLKFVGNPNGMTFFLIAKVLPTKINVTPKIVYRRQNVLEKTRTYVYIDNVTPTITPFNAYIKNTQYQILEPLGGCLGPEGQGTYLTIHTKYYDPEIYKNVLCINLTYGHPIEIPITFNIEGMPIYFEPTIKDGLDAGSILTNSEENYYADIPNFKKDIRVTNLGERSYRLIIIKLRSGVRECSLKPIRAKLCVTPKSIVLKAGAEGFVHITANACEETTVHNEFRLQIVDQFNKKRVYNILFTATAKFIQPRLIWSCKEITMNYYRTHRFKEHLLLETVELINTGDVKIDTVELKVFGPFKVRELFEQRFGKELKLKVDSNEKKELTILLNKFAIKNDMCTHVQGRIVVVANMVPQKTLILKVNIFNPEIKITQPEVILFTKDVERDINVEIENIGCLEAQYKWKKVDESTQFIGEYDDVNDFSLQLLSDIFRMLELTDDESDDEIVNMSQRYQRYRCKLQQLDDVIDIRGILDEIIDHLDLEHKRYAINLNEDDALNSSYFDIERHSSQSYVKKTVNNVLQYLKLEDSYDISDESSELCLKDKSIYFYEKSGTLMENEKLQFKVHLPGVKNGYAQKASFNLIVVGGHTKAFDITLVNLDKTIELSKNNIYLGLKPWYELFKVKVKVANVTQYTVSIRSQESDHKLEKRRRLVDGYIKVIDNKCFDILMFDQKHLRVEGILGFSEEFVRDIILIVNDGEEVPLRLRGQGVMPILTVITKLNRIEQDYSEIVNDYKLLQRIYGFEVFKGITEDDDDLRRGGEEGVAEANDFSQLSIITTSEISVRSAERRLFKVMKTYVIVNNNQELPNGTVLEQHMEMQRFLERLRTNAETLSLLHMVYEDYVKMIKYYDERMPINLKYFTAQPLPFETHGHILNMGQLKMNQFRRFEVLLQFFGPGKLIAAGRTIIKIPGLTVDFKVKKSDDKEFIYYVTDEKSPDFYNKLYRNMYERQIDAETDTKLKHAHSFDYDKYLKHQRSISAKQRKNVQNYYNSLNKSIYMEHKHHHVLCKIFTNSKRNFSDVKMQVVILIKPLAAFYEHGQMIEDYLYIDLHLGPTLPILLRGMIADK